MKLGEWKKDNQGVTALLAPGFLVAVRNKSAIMPRGYTGPAVAVYFPGMPEGRPLANTLEEGKLLVVSLVRNMLKMVNTSLDQMETK